MRADASHSSGTKQHRTQEQLVEQKNVPSARQTGLHHHYLMRTYHSCVNGGQPSARSPLRASQIACHHCARSITKSRSSMTASDTTTVNPDVPRRFEKLYLPKSTITRPLDGGNR